MSAALLPVPASFCARHPGRGARPAAWVGGLTSLSLLRAPGSAPSIANRPFNVTPCATLHAGPLAPSRRAAMITLSKPQMNELHTVFDITVGPNGIRDDAWF